MGISDSKGKSEQKTRILMSVAEGRQELWEGKALRRSGVSRQMGYVAQRNIKKRKGERAFNYGI